MVKNLTRKLLIGVSLLWGLSARAEVIFTLNSQEDFNKCSTLNTEKSESSKGWEWYSYGNYARAELPYANSNDPKADCYLTSPELTLEKDVIYELSINVAGRESFTMYNGNLEILLGQNDDPTSFDKCIKEWDDLSYSDHTIETIQFGVENTGTYKISFHTTSMCFIYNLEINSKGTASAPGLVSDFTAFPDGASNNVNISFTIPDKNVIGTTLSVESLRAVVKRGEDVILDNNYALNEVVSYRDENVDNGLVTYSVVLYNGEAASEEVSTTCWVGPQAPLPVSDITIAPVEGGYNVSWTNPVVGAQGGTLNPNELTFDIVRFIDGAESATFTNVSEMPFYDKYEPSKIEKISYSVTVKNGNLSADAVRSGEVQIGSFNLPLYESFAGAKLGDYWETNAVVGSKLWEMKNSSSNPTVSPFDGDGGFAYFNSYNAYSGYTSRLISPPLNSLSSINPFVEFYFYHDSGVSSKNDRIILEVSKDGGEWIELPETEILRYNTNTGWTAYSFALKDKIQDSQTYRVSFKAISEYGNNMALDNIVIRNKAEFDLEVVSFNGPATVIAGNDGEYKFVVANQGAAKVNTEDYSIVIDGDGIDVAPIESVDIEAGQSHEFTFNISFTAHEAAEEPYNFSVTVNYDRDGVTDNNAASVETTVTSSEKPIVSGLEGTFDESTGTVSLTWEPVVDVNGYEPIDIFESFENGALKTQEFDRFTTVSNGGSSASGSWYGQKWDTFTIVDRSANSYMPSFPHGKQYAMVYKVEADEWLISPELDCFAAATMNLSYSAYFYNTSWQYDVLYSTTDNDVSNFISLFEQPKSLGYGDSGSFKFYSFDNIPASAKYIAIRFKSTSTSANGMFIDNIRITDEFEPVLGYHVYEEGVGRINDEVIDPTLTTYTFNAFSARRFAKSLYSDVADGRAFTVTALWGDGESMKSEPVVLDITTGVDSSVADAMSVHAENGVLVINNATAGTVIYTVDGKLVARCAAGNHKFAVAAGIYVVKGAKSFKVFVK